jgi:acyl carrier protein
MNDNLENEIRDLIYDTCNITEPVEDLTVDSELFGDDSPLGLDSLDAVEIVVAVKNRYGVHIGGQDQAMHVVRTLRSLSDFVRKNRNGGSSIAHGPAVAGS